MCEGSVNLALTNAAQGTFKKVLCVCSVNCLRSPTAAWVLSNPPFNFNTRSAGLDTGLAIVPVTETLLEWQRRKKGITLSFQDALKERLGKEGA